MCSYALDHAGRFTERVADEAFDIRDPSDGGTGPGLALVYGAAQGARGYVWFRSSRTEGTAVEIYLPAEAAATPLDGRVVLDEARRVVEGPHTRSSERNGS